MEDLPLALRECREEYPEIEIIPGSNALVLDGVDIPQYTSFSSSLRANPLI